MTKNDVEKLFNLLDILHPAGKKPRDPATIAAWQMVLEPFDYDQVKQAAVTHARQNRYSPEPAEIVANIPVPEPTPEAERRADRGHAPDDWARLIVEVHAELERLVGTHKRGTIVQAAKAQGIDVANVFADAYFRLRAGG